MRLRHGLVRKVLAVVIGPTAATVLLVVILPIVPQTYTGEQSNDGRARRYESDLLEVLPVADAFSSEEGVYRHFRGYTGGPAATDRRLVGYAFFTTELGGRSRGYTGIMHLLVGLDLNGSLTGVKAVEHHEPYGYFSIDVARFRDQFSGKSVLEPFKVGDDIDAISGATITVTGATGAIRVAARRMAREFIAKRSEDRP